MLFAKLIEDIHLKILIVSKLLKDLLVTYAIAEVDEDEILEIVSHQVVICCFDFLLLDRFGRLRTCEQFGFFLYAVFNLLACYFFPDNHVSELFLFQLLISFRVASFLLAFTDHDFID